MTLPGWGVEAPLLPGRGWEVRSLLRCALDWAPPQVGVVILRGFGWPRGAYSDTTFPRPAWTAFPLCRPAAAAVLTGRMQDSELTATSAGSCPSLSTARRPWRHGGPKWPSPWSFLLCLLERQRERAWERSKEQEHAPTPGSLPSAHIAGLRRAVQASRVGAVRGQGLWVCAHCPSGPVLAPLDQPGLS